MIYNMQGLCPNKGVISININDNILASALRYGLDFVAQCIHLLMLLNHNATIFKIGALLKVLLGVPWGFI